MSVSLVIEPPAARDLADAYTYCQEHGRGEAFLASVDHCFVQISEIPLMYPIVYSTIRRALLRRFAYSVFFIVEDDRAVVLAVRHQRRDISPRLR